MILAALLPSLAAAESNGAASAATSAQYPAAAPLQFSDCRLGHGAMALEAECARLAVPLDHTRTPAASERIELKLARLAATGREARAEPLLFISGGPGQSALDTWPLVASAFRTLRNDHDIILLDQRGTGESARLDCQLDDNDADKPNDLDTDPEASYRLAQRCLGSLERDPRWFTTSLAVRDIEVLREALNITQWNIYAVSYGTRVAQHYLRRYPDAVRAMILDAVLPPDVALGAEVPIHAEQALDNIIARCQADDGCQTAFPDLAARVSELFARLAETPVSLRYEDIRNGRMENTEFGALDLAIVVRLLSYSNEGAAILPSMLHRAATEQALEPFARQARLQDKQLGGSLATAMHSAVICSEDAPLAQLDDETRQALDQTWLGAIVVDALIAGCRDWPAGPVDDDFHEPLRSAVPVLLLSGEADPITPPHYGERVAAGFSQAQHLVIAGSSHMQAPRGCLPKLMAEFIAEPTKAVDERCARAYLPPAFFIDPNGPLP